MESIPKQGIDFIDEVVNQIEKNVNRFERGDFLREVKLRIKARLQEEAKKVDSELSDLNNCIKNIDIDKIEQKPHDYK